MRSTLPDSEHAAGDGRLAPASRGVAQILASASLDAPADRARDSGRRRRRGRRSSPADAPQSSTAEAISVLNTACRSNAERLMTFSTSEVAVCMLQRLGEVVRLGLHLVEQPRVLDRDHRLVGEGSDEIDLALREGAGRLRARQDEHAHHLAVAQQRHAEQRARDGPARRPARADSGSARMSGTCCASRRGSPVRRPNSSRDRRMGAQISGKLRTVEGSEGAIGDSRRRRGRRSCRTARCCRSDRAS